MGETGGASGRANDVFHSGVTEGADGGRAAPTPLNLHALFVDEPDEPELHPPEGTAGSSVPFRLELGCGAGEWLSAQAGAAPHIRWLALELRRDRAYVGWPQTDCARAATRSSVRLMAPN